MTDEEPRVIDKTQFWELFGYIAGSALAAGAFASRIGLVATIIASVVVFSVLYSVVVIYNIFRRRKWRKRHMGAR